MQATGYVDGGGRMLSLHAKKAFPMIAVSKNTKWAAVCILKKLALVVVELSLGFQCIPFPSLSLVQSTVMSFHGEHIVCYLSEFRCEQKGSTNKQAKKTLVQPQIWKTSKPIVTVKGTILRERVVPSSGSCAIPYELHRPLDSGVFRPTRCISYCHKGPFKGL
ncbi:hypothetical protein TRVL_00197 [Trypanosoma vivax]|uniref:Uncharacterized protein n=1 Tax=Trypanosoma vivax (strain Y486) TaxID=1055687 RepID=G0TYC1_TRYVY|nr:hypothetical protein TRVL_00197 [Trypanosoma vivax]CCC48968.1 hypothetical protein, unlikely [Trypanosoma vivax Y486]